MAFPTGWTKLFSFTVDFDWTATDSSSIDGKAIAVGNNCFTHEEIDYIFGKTRADGHDLRFTKSGLTTELNYKRAIWDKEKRRMLIYLDADDNWNGTSRTFDIYGLAKDESTDTSTSTDVFDSDVKSLYVAKDPLNEMTEITEVVGAFDCNAQNDPDIMTDSPCEVSCELDGGDDFYIGAGGGQISFWDSQADFTIETVVRRNGKGMNEYIISQGHNTTNDGLHFGFKSSNKLHIGFWNNDLTDANEYLTFGNWFGASTTFKNDVTNERKLFIDGLLRDSDNPGSGLQNTTGGSDLSIGRRNVSGSSATHYWDGSIQYIELSSATRSQAWLAAGTLMMTHGHAYVTTDLTIEKSGYHRKYTATIDTTSLGSLDSGASIDDFTYTFIIKDTEADDFFTGVNKANPTGGDVRAVDGGDTLVSEFLPIRIIQWDQAAKEAVIQVKLPWDINNTSDTIDFYFSRGDTSQPLEWRRRIGSKNVWGTDVNGQWQLDEPTGEDYRDGSYKNRPGEQGNNPVQTDGEIYKGADFASSDYIGVGEASEADLSAGRTAPPTAQSFSTWLRLDSAGSDRTVYGNRKTGSPNEGIECRFDNGNDNIFVVYDVGSAGQFNCDSSLNSIAVGTIYHLMVTYAPTAGSGKGTDIDIYIDGVVDNRNQSGTETGDITNDRVFGIGSLQGTSGIDNWRGLLEDFRFYYNVKKSAGWAKLEFETVRNRATYLSWSSSSAVGNTLPTGWTGSITLESKDTYVDSNLTDFPALITESEVNSDFWNNIQDGGGDVRITTNANAVIPHEVERCDVVLQKLAVWVKMSSLSSSGGDQVKVHYGSSNHEQPLVADATNGWKNAFPNHALAMHLKEQGEGLTGEYRDSSGNDNHGTAGAGDGTLAPDVATAQIGLGQEGDGSGKYLIADSEVAFPFGAAVRTMSAWANFEDTATEQPIFNYGNDSDGQSIRLAQRTGGIGVAFSGNFRGKVARENGWTHLVAVVPSGATQTDDVLIYVNGSAITPTDLSGTAKTLNTVSSIDPRILRNQDAVYSDRIADEIRLRTVALTAAEIKAEYYNQLDSSNLWSMADDTTTGDHSTYRGVRQGVVQGVL